MTSMQPVASDGAPAPYWTFAGIGAGARMMIPALPGVVVFAAAFGALAAQKGLTLFETVLMSAIVFAGVSQFVAMEIWSPAMTGSLILAIAVSTLVVNLRMVLMSASLQPWIGGSPAWQIYPSLILLTDGSWVASARYRKEGGADVGYLFGSGIIIWLVWVPSTAIGQIFGSLLTDPKRFGVDLIVPLYFVALLAPTLELSRRSLAWISAGLTAIAVFYLVPGHWYVIVGALTGAIVGGLIGDE